MDLWRVHSCRAAPCRENCRHQAEFNNGRLDLLWRRGHSMNVDNKSEEDVALTPLIHDPKKRPESRDGIVDLGQGVARVTHVWFWNSDGKRWARHTTITLLTASDYGENMAQPAASVSTNMTEAQCAALVEALS